MNVLVTAGGTVAPIDDVRQITNLSTGRFGAMIAEAALRRDANVWHLHAPGALLPFDRLAKFNLDAPEAPSELARLESLRTEWRRNGDRCHLVPLLLGTSAEYATRLRTILLENRIDVAFLAMAVSDFAPDPVAGKLSSDTSTLTIHCHRQPKVIQAVRDWSPDVYLVGFKLLSNAPESELIRQAEEACRANRADLTVANDLSTVKAGRHTIHLVRPGQPTETYGPEDDIAERLVDRVFTWATSRPHDPSF
jgi:phosphopantothenate---cysteine ligase (CTP)